MPVIAIKVLELAAVEEAPLSEIVKVISDDPAISARVLRVVNSPCYGLRRPVTSVAQAVSALGLVVVKNLALGFSLVRDYRTGPRSGLDYEAFWRNSLLGAVAARGFSSAAGSRLGEDIFFIGLLQDIGVLALNECLPDRYAEVLERSRSGHPLEEAERELLGADHMEVGGYLGERWRLPEAFYLPIAYHHRPEELPAEVCAETRTATGLLWVSANAVEFFSCPRGSAQALERIAHAGETYGLFEREEVHGMMSRISAEVSELANAFDVARDRQKSYAEILEEANAQLCESTLSFERVISDQVKMIEELKEMVYEDDATGLFNRRSFDAALHMELYRAQRYRRPLALIIGDLASLGEVAASHEREAANTMLKKVGAAIRRDLRESDATFRYGRQQFALILPETESDGAMVVAERFRRLVEGLDVGSKGRRVRLTVSLGIAAVGKGQEVTKGELIAAADAACQRAKASGRSCLMAGPDMLPKAHRTAGGATVH